MKNIFILTLIFVSFFSFAQMKQYEGTESAKTSTTLQANGECWECKRNARQSIRPEIASNTNNREELVSAILNGTKPKLPTNFGSDEGSK